MAEKVISLEGRIAKKREEEEELQKEIRELLAPLKEELASVCYDKPAYLYFPYTDAFYFYFKVSTPDPEKERLKHTCVERSAHCFVIENLHREVGEPRLVTGFRYAPFKEKMKDLDLESGMRVCIKTLFSKITLSEGGFRALFGEDELEIRCIIEDSYNFFITLP